LKKTLLSAAIASTFALSGCLDSSPDTGENAGSVTNPDTSTAVYPIFSPAEGKLPIPNDLIFQSTDAEAGTVADGTFDLGDTSPPVTTALNELSGASTVAPIDIAMSGKIDPGSLKGPGNPDQNVWLVELLYASGEPVVGLSISEPPTVEPNPANHPTYAVEHIELDGASTIRINPKQPLDPKKRYVVAITTGVTDIAGDAIIRAPGAAGYEALTKTDAQAPLKGSLAALAPIRSLVNLLWEPTSIGYINTVRGAYSRDPITDQDIAVTYSFTTSNDEKVLGYINDPGKWFSDSLLTRVKVGGVQAALQAGATDYASVQPYVTGAVSGWTAESLHPLLAGCDGFPAGQQRFDCAGKNLVTTLETPGNPTGIEVDFPDPEASTITMIDATEVDVTALGLGLGQNETPPGPIPVGKVFAKQGVMTIPYYSGLPVGFPTAPTEATAAAGAGLPLKYTNWVADDALASALENLGLSIPQSDPTKSKAVNYLFPFPKKQGDVTIPVLAIYPNSAALMGAPVKPMIWGHGLTGNRTQALGYGSLLVASGLTAGASAFNAVIAIDEPLHGVTPDADSNPSPFDLSAAGAVERHFGFQSGGVGPGNPPTLVADGGSGSMFVNIESFLTTRDSNRQHVLDLLTLRQSISSAVIGGNTLGSNYFYSGHSLGTINSQAAIAVANSNTTATDATAAADDFKAAAFFTPGGGITRFFENSPAFAATIVNGLASNGVTPDTSSYQTYLNVLQATMDTVDAINFADDFATPLAGLEKVHYFEAVNDLVIPIKVDEESRTLRLPTGSPLGNTVDLAGSVSYLSGAEPLAKFSGATFIEAAGTVTDKVTAVRYKTCAATHSTPSLPGSDAFAENLAHVISIISTDGAAVVANANLTGQDLVETTDPLPLIDLAPTCP
jgi:hypothetical protein